LAKGRKTSYSGQFQGKLQEMLESPALYVLSRAAHAVLYRIEREFGCHGGVDNGKLPVTFDQFEECGLHRRSVAPAIRELEALGFIEVTERGCAGNAGHGKPNLFRLTYRPSEGAPSDGTHEWRRVKTMDEARRIATSARRTPPENSLRRGGKRVRKIKAQCHKLPSTQWQKPPPKSVAETATEGPKSPVAETATTSISSVSPGLWPYRSGRRRRRRGAARARGPHP
jgi:hypothetical protein